MTVNTLTGEIVADFDSVEARAITNRIKDAVESTWSLLLEAHDRRAWHILGYASWRDYAITEFGIGKSRAYQLLDQARVIREIEAAGSTDVEITEAEARDIKPVLAEVVDAIAAVVAEGEPETVKAKVREVISKARAAAPRRRPLPDQFLDATIGLTKAADRLAKLLTDDRFTQNADQVASKYRSDLMRVRDALDGVITRLS